MQEELVKLLQSAKDAGRRSLEQNARVHAELLPHCLRAVQCLEKEYTVLETLLACVGKNVAPLLADMRFDVTCSALGSAGEELVPMLVDAVIEENACERMLSFALVCAVKVNDAARAARLMQMGATTSAVQGHSALHQLVLLQGDTTALRRVLSGSDVNAHLWMCHDCQPVHLTPLSLLCKVWSVHDDGWVMFDWLVSQGARTDLKTVEMACTHGDAALVGRVVSQCSEPDRGAVYELVVRSRDPAKVREVAQALPSVPSSALFDAVQHDAANVLEILLDVDPRGIAAYQRCQTLLDVALKHAGKRLIRLLIQRGARLEHARYPPCCLVRDVVAKHVQRVHLKQLRTFLDSDVARVVQAYIAVHELHWYCQLL